MGLLNKILGCNTCAAGTPDCDDLVEQRKQEALNKCIYEHGKYLAKSQGSRQRPTPQYDSYRYRDETFAYELDDLTLVYRVEHRHMETNRSLVIKQDGNIVFEYKDFFVTRWSDETDAIHQYVPGDWEGTLGTAYYKAKEKEKKRKKEEKKQRLQNKWGIDPEDCEL